MRDTPYVWTPLCHFWFEPNALFHKIQNLYWHIPTLRQALYLCMTVQSEMEN